METPEKRKRKMPGDKRNSQKKTSARNQNTNDSVKLSKALSWLLRHQAIKLGFTMTSGGYVPISEILESSHPRFANRGYTLDEIQRVVETNDKQRFRIESLDASLVYPDRTDNEGSILCIRATQGHSISSTVVDPDLILTPLGPQQLLEYSMIVHGTYHDSWKKIEQEGLNRMNRTHIHFTTGLPKDSDVISGMRKTSQVYIFLNVPMCVQDKIPFFRSDNGVVLTAGFDGVLSPKYFSHVTDAQTGDILWKTDRMVQF